MATWYCHAWSSICGFYFYFKKGEGDLQDISVYKGTWCQAAFSGLFVFSHWDHMVEGEGTLHKYSSDL